MKLYKITRKSHIVFAKDGSVDFDVTAVTSFQGTQADARKMRIVLEEPLKEIKATKRPMVEVEEVDVPANKAGLLVWLNQNAV